MKLILKDKAKVTIFTNIFRNLKNILDDANITFTPTKVYMQGMDQSHALLVELNIKKDWFDFYEADENLDNENFGLHCETFFQIINCLNEGQYIELLWENGGDKMSIAFNGEETISKEFELTRLDMDLENMEIPDVEYQADICLKSSECKYSISMSSALKANLPGSSSFTLTPSPLRRSMSLFTSMMFGILLITTSSAVSNTAHNT